MTAPKPWTESDAQAEIARILELPAERVAKEIRSIVQAVRAVGASSGHGSIAENGVDALREIVGAGFGDMTSLERESIAVQKVRDRLALVRGALDAAKEELADEKGWWAPALEAIVSPSIRFLQGGYLFGLVGEDKGSGFLVRTGPDVAFTPKYLIVDPATADGALSLIQFCNSQMNPNGHELPLSTFDASKWADVKAMLTACAFEPVEVTPANRIVLMGRLAKPGPFRAVLWGPARMGG